MAGHGSMLTPLLSDPFLALLNGASLLIHLLAFLCPIPVFEQSSAILGGPSGPQAMPWKTLVDPCPLPSGTIESVRLSECTDKLQVQCHEGPEGEMP